MGEVVSLGEARHRRSELRRALAEHAVMHPALRWMSGESAWAHRRTPTGLTACGLGGPLTLAERGMDRCATCYPSRSSTAP